MIAAPSVRFPIRFDGWAQALLSATFIPTRRCDVTVGDEVTVRMGWAFRARFPRSAVVSTSPVRRATLSRGVHGFGGRWLVNGSGDGLLAINLEPAQRAYVAGFPVRLRQLTVSVDDPSSLASSLASSHVRGIETRAGRLQGP